MMVVFLRVIFYFFILSNCQTKTVQRFYLKSHTILYILYIFILQLQLNSRYNWYLFLYCIKIIIYFDKLWQMKSINSLQDAHPWIPDRLLTRPRNWTVVHGGEKFTCCHASCAELDIKFHPLYLSKKSAKDCCSAVIALSYIQI